LLGKNRIIFVSDISPVEMVCSICGFVARSNNDLLSIEKESSCEECILNFKYLDLDSWKKGNRPSKKRARSKMTIKAGDFKNE